eukprot:CAMPEP_0185568616 /NCGR_PEP_ID=MMETSP0434-20130131/1517_1 /TAXON_ID=626734 ORGANISM="Favella taraikaensis, Strain Fe Narragansett Bay" /NCGR_SAMPLE_ID=MMETSP0434 /ASSEMBLY_ACC=CAM_ASM_000379 /LENGTH=107 /DNA_ID=CAMNT_0028183187 /DNA_START=356 /DNA_END=679 /DNA_ORIENTATION=+
MGSDDLPAAANSSCSDKVILSAERQSSETTPEKEDHCSAQEEKPCNRVTIPNLREQQNREGRAFAAHVMGADTENELSLSRRDDSDMSEEDEDEDASESVNEHMDED